MIVCSPMIYNDERIYVGFSLVLNVDVNILLNLGSWVASVTLYSDSLLDCAFNWQCVAPKFIF